MAERLTRARQPIVVQTAEIHPLFEIDRALAGSRQRAFPIVMRIQSRRMLGSATSLALMTLGCVLTVAIV